MPIIGQPVFNLEELAGQALVVDGVGGDDDGGTERLIFCLSRECHGRGVCHRDRSVEMVGVNVIKRRSTKISKSKRLCFVSGGDAPRNMVDWVVFGD